MLTEAALDAAGTLGAAGLSEDTARRDASLLARHAVGWDAARWLTEARSTQASRDFRVTFDALIARRGKREPLAYITGQREFYGRVFAVEPGVLIPRPETEIIVDAVLEIVRARTPPRILDIGTGSGCLAITVAMELPAALLTATDNSEAALGVARANARQFGVDTRITFRAGDLLADGDGPFDIIMSNPPYVPERDKASLDPEVRDYEPGAALFAGPDGLDVIRRLVPAAAAALAPGGWLIFEIGAGQADAVQEIVNRTPGVRWERVLPDLQSIPRVVVVTTS